MALIPSTTGREHNKFIESPTYPAQPAVLVVLDGAIPAQYNSGSAEYPDDVTTIYKFYRDATLLKTITLIFTDTSQEKLLSWSIV